MELFFRTIFHNLQKVLFFTTGLTNHNMYLNNLKRLEDIIKNDYRNFTGEELSAESEGSCSMASGSVRSNEEDERTDDFEIPSRNEESGGSGSDDDSEVQSDERQD
jgi:hypothetical protein